MSSKILQYFKLLSNNKIKITNHKLKKVIHGYSFIYISSEIKLETNEKVYQKMKESSIIIIKEYKEKNEEENDIQYFIIGFKQTLLIVKQESIQFIYKLLSCKPDLTICFLENSKEQFNKHIIIDYHEKVADHIFCKEISYFEREFVILPRNSFSKAIIPCIAGYLINNGYMKTFEDRLQAYSKRNTRTYEPDEFIFLKLIDSTLISQCSLYYNIEEEQLMVIKKHSLQDVDYQKLKAREIDNYENTSHPLIPTFFGTMEQDGQQSIIIEFINGQTLNHLSEIDLNEDQKLNLVLELIDIFIYLHSKDYIYRDLKPNNIMIDRNKHVVLLDFDLMIKKNIDNNEKIIVTADFGEDYMAPELKSEEYYPTCKSDIYSIGKIISFIFGIDKRDLNDFQKNNKHEQMNDKDLKEMLPQQKYKILYEIISQCTEEIPDQRPSIQILNHLLLLTIFVNYSQQNKASIDRLINDFVLSLAILNQIFLNVFIIALFYIVSGDIKNVIHNFSLADEQNDPEAQFNLGTIYYEGRYINRDIKKAIHYLSLAAEQNHPKAQFNLGAIYYEGRYINRNINKAIHYLSLAAEQNETEAQYNLGAIYYEGRYINRDIKKAIHYLSLAAEQNHPKAQFNLGAIYYEGRYINRNINKAIHYFSLAADQNDSVAQFNLGYMYYEGQYTNFDISKAIHYFTLAAGQNDPKAQFNLGIIYYEGRYVNRNINKAIHYFSLAAEQNDPEAQFILGYMYYKGQYINCDINKAIHYFSLAADQNHQNAQFYLGVIYNEGRYINRNINKAIHYFTLAAGQNDSVAQFNLGYMYYEGQYTNFDISKAIHYFTLAAGQNYPKAQFYLGIIYYEGQYINRDINKSIHYFTLAASQYHPKAQFYLGVIYYEGRYVNRDINKSIYYFSLAADQNEHEAQFNLGIIYYKGQYINRNINKSIHYFTLAANQNHPKAQFFLGYLYYEGRYVNRDINKSIYYFSLAANQNHPEAQFNLGYLYYVGQYNDCDITKAIHYFSLAANQNDPEAQNILGVLFYEGRYVNRDINKSMYYFSLAANQNHPKAQFNLGLIYYFGNHVGCDITKAIQYFSFAANQNHPEAQFYLGLIYFKGKYVKCDINEAIHYFTLASNYNFSKAQLILGLINFVGFRRTRNIKEGIWLLIRSSDNRCIQAFYAMGYLLHEGKYMSGDINAAIRYYKEGSSFNNQYSKNNLGIIYKNGFEDKIKPNIGLAAVYFEEAIKKKNDAVAMYNLGHLYLYNDQLKDNKQQSIYFLIQSFTEGFHKSLILLCLSLIKSYGYSKDKISQRLENVEMESFKLSLLVCQMIDQLKLYEKEAFEKIYEYHRKIDYLYNFRLKPIESKDIKKVKEKQTKNEKIVNISSIFYEGFEINLDDV